MKLDLGCGKNKKRNFTGIDVFNFPGVDYVIDLKKGKLPFKNDEVDEIYSNHFFEHLTIDEIVELMKEIFRVCKNSAKIEIHVPHFSGDSNFYEFHKTSFRYNSFREFTSGSGMFVADARFRRIKTKIHFSRGIYFWNYLVEPIVNFWKVPIVYEKTCLRNLFPAFEVEFAFKVIKKVRKK